MEFFLFLSSEDSKAYFPQNNPGQFSVALPDVLYLDGTWTCALRDIQCWPSTSSDLYVFCDAVEDSYVRDRKLPILQRIPQSDTGSHVIETYDSTIQFKVSRSVINTLTLYIRDSTMKPVSFKTGATYCTLHFTKSQ